jgi:hypothetical protein
MMAALRRLQLFGVWLAATAAGVAVIAMPRAVAPLELPALELDTRLVAEQEQADARLAAQAPKTDAAKELWSRYTKFGETEVMLLDQAGLLEQRRRAMHRAQDLVVAESGPRAGNALRALALSKFEAALDGEVPQPELKGVMGILPYVLSQYLLTRDGEELGPHFVLRTFFKARWNRMCGLPPEADLSPIERRAYFGWMGLHAANLPMRERRQALLGYAAAGGDQAEQAQGVLAFLDHDYGRAAISLERAYALRVNLRLRNYLRGARVAAGQLGGELDSRTAAASQSWASAHN